MKRRRKRSAKRARRSSAKQSYSILPYLILLLVVLGLVFALNKLYEARSAFAGRGGGVIAYSGGPNSIGYIGCSNTQDSVTGYHMAPNNGVIIWNPYTTGGQTISRWASPTAPAWGRFDTQVRRYGQPILVWVQMCENEREGQATYDEVKQMLTNLRVHAPTATFYISTLNSYDPTTLCPGRNGPDYIYDLIAFRDQAVAEGLALRGPDLGPLTVPLLQSDQCHPNDAGRVDPLGKQLVGFFDGLYVTPTPIP